MVNFRIIARIFSLIIIVEGLFMLAAAGLSYLYDEPAGVFTRSAIITLVIGIIGYTPLRNEEKIYGNREGYIIITGIWLIIALFGTLPYLLSGFTTSFTDAFFEAMSGFTTTGATIFSDPESMTHGILFWRSLTQWLGAMGIIIVSLSILPVAKTLNIHLTQKDFTGQTSDKINPRSRETAKQLLFIFVTVTFIETILLSLGGMSFFDALCHSFSTMSTGGFSTRNDNLAGYSSPYIMIVMMFFMFLAGTNMAIIYFGINRNFRKVFENNEFVFYTAACLLIATMAGSVHYFYTGSTSLKRALEGGFQAISMLTTTGFYTDDFNLWGGFLTFLLFLLMFTGGTTGSASGSLKIIRLLLVLKNNIQELKRLFHPNALLPVRHNHKTVSRNIISNILIYLTLYLIVVCCGALIMSFLGYDIITSFSTSAAMVGNVGPSLGTLGPFSDFSTVSTAGKWFLSFLMLLGRLELLTVMLLFSKNFYKR
jgi:trk system potassium uptake protein TrkH